MQELFASLQPVALTLFLCGGVAAFSTSGVLLPGLALLEQLWEWVVSVDDDSGSKVLSFLLPTLHQSSSAVSTTCTRWAASNGARGGNAHLHFRRGNGHVSRSVRGAVQLQREGTAAPRCADADNAHLHRDGSFMRVPFSSGPLPGVFHRLHNLQREGTENAGGVRTGNAHLNLHLDLRGRGTLLLSSGRVSSRLRKVPQNVGVWAYRRVHGGREMLTSTSGAPPSQCPELVPPPSQCPERGRVHCPESE